MATYKHKSIRRFSLGGFEFKNFILVTVDGEQDARFREMLSEQPQHLRNQIVAINEDALAALEQQVDFTGGGVSRGALGTGDILAGVKEAAGARAIAAEAQHGPSQDALKLLEQHAIESQTDNDATASAEQQADAAAIAAAQAAAAAAANQTAKPNPLAGLLLKK